VAIAIPAETYGEIARQALIAGNVYNLRSEIRRMYELHLTLVQRAATLGADCTIIWDVPIRQYALIGAGAVVKDVPDFALVMGNLVQIIG
jgi:UDP-2-acetamido-3-amino-2,3-dideoxy-glucuronate N-acetyltransferase